MERTTSIVRTIRPNYRENILRPPPLPPLDPNAEQSQVHNRTSSTARVTTPPVPSMRSHLQHHPCDHTSITTTSSTTHVLQHHPCPPAPTHFHVTCHNPQVYPCVILIVAPLCSHFSMSPTLNVITACVHIVLQRFMSFTPHLLQYTVTTTYKDELF